MVRFDCLNCPICWGSLMLLYENGWEWCLPILIEKSTWSPTINALVEKGSAAIAPYDLVLDYDYWTYCKTLHWNHGYTGWDSRSNCRI